MRVVFWITVVTSLAALTLATSPGKLATIVFDFPFFFVTLPGAAAWGLLLLSLAIREMAKAEPRPRLARVACGVAIAACGLVILRVPQRLSLAVYATDLRALIEASPTTEYWGAELEQRVGPFWIDRYGSDARGGDYFRTHTAGKGLGPDLMSYGFAHRPNAEGTPFGNADYATARLLGDWYWFVVSDDW